MGRDPAFLMYPGDYVNDTMGFTFEQKGIYFDILCMQFKQGHLILEKIKNLMGQDKFDLNWPVMEDKFLTDKNNLYYNKRMDEEKEKRQNYTESRRRNLRGSSI